MSRMTGGLDTRVVHPEVREHTRLLESAHTPVKDGLPHLVKEQIPV